MARFIDPFYTNNFLDANIFNEVANGQNEAVEVILRVYDEESITLLLPYSVQFELEDASTPDTVRKASQNFIYSIEVQLTEGEKKLSQNRLGPAQVIDPKLLGRETGPTRALRNAFLGRKRPVLEGIAADGRSPLKNTHLGRCGTMRLPM